MSTCDRRAFLQLAAVAGAGRLLADSQKSESAIPMRLGVMLPVGKDPNAAIAKVHQLGIPTCFIYTDNFDRSLRIAIQDALHRYGIEATALESLGPGKNVWDFRDGPSTIGLVPPETRQARIDSLKRASDFARELGIPAVQTHCGFIPENPRNPLYDQVVKALRDVTSHCRANGQKFLMETGQETPVTMLRAIEDVGLDNIGAGLDTANLILYGKADPVVAVELLGSHIHSVHAKDGLYPTDPWHLGKEVLIGQGMVNFPKVIQGLRAHGYRGAITIEREISGPRQLEDIRKEKLYLEKILAA